jgi:hypothetical protein
VRKKREKEKNNYIEKKKRWGPKGRRKEGRKYGGEDRGGEKKVGGR